jgi:hypothetical protein
MAFVCSSTGTDAIDEGCAFSLINLQRGTTGAVTV